MSRSFVSRVWQAVKPPPPLPARRRLNRAQRRLIRVTSMILIIGIGAWAVYAYIASASDRALSHYNAGMRLLGAGDFQGASSAFTSAIAILPEYGDAYLGRGKASQASGQNQAALADFEMAIAINPASESAYVFRGILERSNGDSQKALEDFTKSIQLHPTSDAYYQRGLTYHSLHQTERAVDDYDAAISYNPGAPYVYRARASARRELGDAEGGRADQEKAERVDRTQ